MGELNFKRLLPVVISFLFIGFFYQNCSTEDFAREGNGQPYEGLSVGGFTERPPLDEDNDPPAEDFNSGSSGNTPGNENPPQETYFDCENLQSDLIESVFIGRDSTGAEVIIARKEDGTGYIRPWGSETQTWHSFNREITPNLNFDGISLHSDFPNVLQIILRFRSKDGRSDFTEIMNCK